MHQDNNMPRRTRRGFELHTKHDEYKNRLKEAKENIQTILNSYYNPVIEFSGGKDSLVLLNLFCKEDPTLPVFYYVPSYSYNAEQIHASIKTVKNVIKSAESTGATNIHNMNLPIKENGVYNCRDYFPLLFECMEKWDCDLEVLGIRGGESITRKHRVKGPLIRNEGNRMVTFPIRHLTVDDVWSYIITEDLFYNPQYDVMGPLYGWDKVRFTSNYNENNLAVGGQYYFEGIFFNSERNEEVNQEEWKELVSRR
jgi:3'-phosphoadenosine 5'-phosphosulfate sulfotransferase (PAPS reductase)/FAD synthetase